MNAPIDRNVKRRALIALAGAIAIHEIVAGFIPPSHPKNEPAPTVISEVITLRQRHATPRPTPPPTPAPKATLPPTPPPHATFAPLVRVAAAPRMVAPRHHHRGGAAAPRVPHIIVAHRPKEIALVTPAPLRAGSTFERGKAQGLANGGTGLGAGPGNGDSGDEGNGVGNGRGGNGNGLDSATSPCGHPYFVGLRNHYRDGKFYEDVRIMIRLRDGSMFEDDLHWPWVYANEADNPWSDQNLSNKEMEVSLQFPPPGYDVADNQKPETAVALKYSRRDGGSDLPDCPGAPPGV